MKYLNHLKLIDTIVLLNGNFVNVFELGNIPQEEFEEWAVGFRQKYCSDSKIDALRNGTGLSRHDYLLNMVFPNRKGFGPGTRLGDFTELLISDYLTYILNYVVPKDRYTAKFNKNTSSQGTDVIGLKKNIFSDSPNDELLIIEVKGLTSGKKPVNRLQDAVDDIQHNNDEKAAVTLNAIKHRALDRNDLNMVSLIERFQNYVENPYIKKYGAAAVQDKRLYDKKLVSKTDAEKQINTLLFINKEDLMKFINSLYDKAADIND